MTKTKLALPQEAVSLIKTKREILNRIASEKAVIARAEAVQVAHTEAKNKADEVAERLRAAKGAVFAGHGTEKEVAAIEAEQREAEAALKQAGSEIDAANAAVDVARQALTSVNEELTKIDKAIREHIRLWNFNESIQAAKMQVAEIAPLLVKEMARVAALWGINDRFVGGGGSGRAIAAGKDAIEALETAFFTERATTISLWQLLESETEQAEAGLVQALEEADIDIRHRWALSQ
ncbi:hypothetical protein [Ralstonia chuxiongensis]|uniref:hypothetical protein n=1 Tax=Ralstonia chuxiongensis TaxID=2957504 RepID=UPI0028F6637B|nr:hypothetical protein [Ralstonia chuxiongensis]CAJ0781896.1 hypothetical protein R8510_04934 [Ralstonia chuxiongensis]